jgi:alpha-N-acetylglucosamine transferase
LSAKESYDTSISKFLAFNQTQYLRILHLDSDATILKNMDDLFLLPSAPVAMPRAYWMLARDRSLTPQLMLLEPSTKELQRLLDAAEAESRTDIEFDREILNTVYRDSAMVLPHRSYGLVTSEFRRTNHTAYHGNAYEVWNPDRALAEASLVHFSDHPLPKPWILWPTALLGELQPQCHDIADANRVGCRNRELWLDLYRTFRKRRKDLCGLLSVPAPAWPPPKEVPDKDEEV